MGGALASRLKATGWEVYTPAKGDPELFKRDLGTVFYCAGLTADFDKRPFDAVAAHASLLSDILRADRFTRLVYTSSTRLYDSLAKAEVSETEPLVFDVADPRQVYDLSKALGENLTVARSLDKGSVARLANVYDWADGAPGFLSEWLIKARTGRKIILQSSPHVARDYIHLDDVVAAMIAIAGRRGPIFNVASGELVTNGAIAEIFEEAGWTVSFTGDASPPPPPRAKVSRLANLGVTPQPVRSVVAAYLEGLKA